MNQNSDSTSENLVHYAYCRWAEQYSKKNWISNCPLWSELSDTDKDFWKTYIEGVRMGFKNEKKDLPV